MKKTFAPRALLALSLAAALAGCAGMSGSTVLVDGTRGLDNFNRVGDANWSAIDGAIQATAGGKDPGYLVTKVSYTDFVVRAEFWASDDANSGIFLRCQNPAVITDENCYEANIFDQRPDPTYGTGAIVKRPMVIKDGDGNEVIAIRSMCYLAISYDHRNIDGADASRFLGAVKRRLEAGEFEGDLGL